MSILAAYTNIERGKDSGEGEHWNKSYTIKLRFVPMCFIDKTEPCTPPLW